MRRKEGSQKVNSGFTVFGVKSLRRRPSSPLKIPIDAAKNSKTYGKRHTFLIRKVKEI